MKRWTLAALAAASLLSATAIAETVQLSHAASTQPNPSHVGAARWRSDAATEKVAEYVPSVNYVLEGQTGGAFVIPSL